MFLSKSSTLVWNWKSAHIYESSDKYARSTMDHNPKHSKGILTRMNTTQEWEEIERKFQWQKCSSRKDASFILTWKSAHINESSDKYARRTLDHNPKHSKGILTRINTTQEWEEIERKFQWQKCSSRKDASFILTWKSAHINESSDKYAWRTMDHNPKHPKAFSRESI